MDSPAYNPDIPMGAEETRDFTAVAPTNNTEFVLMADDETTLTYFKLSTINSIIRMIENQAQTATPQYIYEVRRDGYKIRNFRSNLVKAEIQGPVFPQFPLNLSSADYQLYMRQPVTGTGLAGRTLSVTFQKSLV